MTKPSTECFNTTISEYRGSISRRNRMKSVEASVWLVKVKSLHKYCKQIGGYLQRGRGGGGGGLSQTPAFSCYVRLQQCYMRVARSRHTSLHHAPDHAHCTSQMSFPFRGLVTPNNGPDAAVRPTSPLLIRQLPVVRYNESFLTFYDRSRWVGGCGRK